MKKGIACWSILFLLLSSLVYGQSTSYKVVFNEQFEDNRNNWSIYDSDQRKSSIVGGKLIDEYHTEGSMVCNVIDVKFDSDKPYILNFSIANLNYEYYIKKKVKFPNYGFVWSFKDFDNFNFILFQQDYITQGDKSSLVTYYKIGSYVVGNLITHQDWTIGYNDSKLKAGSSFNSITLHRLENAIYFYSGNYDENSTFNEMMQGTCPAEKWFSTKCGILIGHESKVVLDNLLIKEKTLSDKEVIKEEIKPEIKPVLEASSGSGLILSTDGFIATNYHVIENAQNLKVDIDIKGIKKTYNAEIIKSDKANDLAIIKIQDITFSKTTPLPYGIKTTGVRVGEKVVAMGYPLISYQGTQLKVTDGIISSNTGYQDDPTCYQISAPIQPGNSGGPLFDMNGNLIGITNAGIQSAQNVGYSIKASYLMNFLETITSVAKPPSQSKLSGKSLPDIIDELKPYIVLIRVNDGEVMSSKKSEFPISELLGGYYTNNLKDYSWNPQKKVWEEKDKFNFRSELYLTENLIYFERGSNGWLQNKWSYVGFDNKKNVYNFYDERGQGIDVDKEMKFVKFYFDRDPKTDHFMNCAVYGDLVKDPNVYPKEEKKTDARGLRID